MTDIPVPVIVKRHRAITTAFILAVAVIIGLIGGGAYFALQHFAPSYNPIYFPGQHIATPTVHISQDVTVTATRCNRSSKPVTYRAVKTWVDVDDPGTEYLVGVTEATQPPGCTRYTFTNPMPASVISRTTGLLSTGRTHVTWVIAAADTPEGHAHPVTVSWTTTNIVVTK